MLVARYRGCRGDGCHPDPAFLHRGVCSEENGVGCVLHPALCQVLHHWCDCAGGGCAGGSASGGHPGPGLLCQGQYYHLSLHSTLPPALLSHALGFLRLLQDGVLL